MFNILKMRGGVPMLETFKSYKRPSGMPLQYISLAEREASVSSRPSGSVSGSSGLRAVAVSNETDESQCYSTSLFFFFFPVKQLKLRSVKLQDVLGDDSHNVRHFHFHLFGYKSKQEVQTRP